MIRPLLACLLATVLVGCAGVAPVAAPQPPATTILISLDGLRAAEVGSGRTPNLDALARDGVRARHLRPAYPALTFPNHYTLVTGLLPDRHGVVHNRMEDPALGRFDYTDAAVAADPRWWGGEPLWSTAEKAGVRTATMFWPGSTAPIGGVRPSDWRAYDGTVPGTERVDTVLEWLGRPEATRPRLVTLYFEDIDNGEHGHGPGSPEALASIAKVDGYIGRLLEGLAVRGLAGRVNIVAVSDHGMAAVPAGNVVAIEDMAPGDVATNVTTGQSVGFRPLPGREAEAQRVLVGRHAHYECWTREALPSRWNYGRHPRVPPIVCQMDEGWDAATRARIASRSKSVRGSHGFDPDLPSMRAMLVASGPSFRRGVVLPPVDSVDVYPMLARVLGITPLPNDGDPKALAAALR